MKAKFSLVLKTAFEVWLLLWVPTIILLVLGYPFLTKIMASSIFLFLGFSTFLFVFGVGRDVYDNLKKLKTA